MSQLGIGIRIILWGLLSEPVQLELSMELSYIYMEVEVLVVDQNLSTLGMFYNPKGAFCVNRLIYWIA